MIEESTAIVHKAVHESIDTIVVKNHNAIEENFEIRKMFKNMFIAIDSSPIYQLKKQYPEIYNALLNKPIASSTQSPDFNNYARGTGAVHSDGVERLEEMMQSMNGQNEAQDPELKQLSGMLESILDIQHPDRVQDKLRKLSEAQRGQVFAIGQVQS